MPFDGQCDVMYNFNEILFDVKYETYLFAVIDFIVLT